MMKTLNFKVAVVLLCVFFTAYACSSDDDSATDVADEQPDDIDDVIQTGDPHTYSFTIHDGALAGQTFSGEIEQNEGNGVIYYHQTPNSNEKIITIFFVGNEEVTFGGHLIFQNNGEEKAFGVEFDSEQSPTGLAVILDADPQADFESPVGHYTISHANFMEIPGFGEDTDVLGGVADFKVSFDGVYVDQMRNNEQVHVSGEIKFNFPDLD